MFFVLHILTVHLHHPVSWSQPAQLGAGAGLHFADELSASVPLALQVKPVSARPFRQETQPRSQLTLHRRASKEGRGRISGQSTGACPEGDGKSPVFNPMYDFALR